MSTVIKLESPSVEVRLPHGLDEKRLREFAPFDNWLRQLTHSLSLQSNPSHPFHAAPYALHSINIQSYDMFGGVRVGFLKMTTDVRNELGDTLAGAVFLRGPSVAMLVMLIPDDVASDSPEAAYDERYVIMTVQARVPAGSLEFVELPAGMVDEDGAFAGTAAREIQEELGMEIPADELQCLSEMAAEGQPRGEEGLAAAMYPSVGGCDEYIPIFMHEKRVPRSQLKEWTGKLTGLREEGERITLKLVKMKDLWREGARDGKCLAALALWEGLRREGKL